MIKWRLLSIIGAIFLLPDFADAGTFVYVSNADDGDISVYSMNTDNGELEPSGRVRAGNAVMPMALSPDQRHLYASIRSAPFSVASYAVDPASGQLTHLSTAPLPESMAYISVDRTGRYLFGASYGGDLISVNAIGTGGVVQGEPVQVMRTGRNAHSILADPSNRFVYVPNLGSDQIMQLVFDGKTGLLSPNKPETVRSQPGAGPRHFVFSADGKFVYVLNELIGTVASYAFDSNTGLLSQGELVSAVPRTARLLPGKPRGPQSAASGAAPAEDFRDKIWAADIHMTPDGRFLYASERTSSTIAVFAVDAATGKLSYFKSVDTEKQPRGFQIDPRGKFLVASGEKSDLLSVYRIDQTSGDLQLLKRYPVGKGANWVLFASFE